jgi:hypothetical protein
MVDPDDAPRVQRAIDDALRLVMRALGNVSMRAGGPDRRAVVELCDREPWQLTPAERARIDRLAWKYRRELPPHLAPKLPPFDPLVRELMDA